MKKYRLSYHGTVEYEDCGRDDRTMQLLLTAGKMQNPTLEMLRVAAQELDEEAVDRTISMAIIIEEEEED